MIKILIIVAQTIAIVSLISYLVIQHITVDDTPCGIGEVCHSDSGVCGKGKKCVDDVLVCERPKTDS